MNFDHAPSFSIKFTWNFSPKKHKKLDLFVYTQTITQIQKPKQTTKTKQKTKQTQITNIKDRVSNKNRT
ncbi:TPA: hypothetical protein ACGWGH_004534, partial [Salmonella enterica]